MSTIDAPGFAKPALSTRRPKGRLAASAIALLMLSGSLVASAGAAPAPNPAPTPNTLQPAPAPSFVPGMPPSFAGLVERVSPAVVTIEVDREQQMQLSALDGFDFLPGQLQRNGRGQQAPMMRSRAAGSGFIIDPNGYIVTNNHVVESGRKITVHLADKRSFEAKLVGTDPDTDVALLKVDAKSLPVVAFGDDRRLRVGDWVVAVGNPFGLGGTVTAGIVSSMGRDIGGGPYTDYIQIDAPINRGNSGGPTFDASGRVVGMNTAIYSPSGGSVGIGFAVPASVIRTVVEQLKAQGHVDRGWLGVEIQSVTPDIASSLGLSDAKGALIANVTENSPASRAGFRQGDVVVELNGTRISDSRDLSRDVANLHAGEKANFTVLRDGSRRTLVATIDKRNPERLAGNTAQPQGESSLGLTLMPINPALRQQYELDDKLAGVVITAVDPSSEAADKGLRAGDVITRVNGRAVRMPSDIARNIAEAKKAGRESVLLLVAGDEGEHFVALKIA
jgi:serine protease Do